MSNAKWRVMRPSDVEGVTGRLNYYHEWELDIGASWLGFVEVHKGRYKTGVWNGERAEWESVGTFDDLEEAKAVVLAACALNQ